MNKAIKITPTRDEHASCCVCLAQNYKTESNHPGGPDVYVQDLYNLQIGSQILCLCPHCLALIQAQVGQQLIHRNLPEVHLIVKDSRLFAPKIVKGTKEILRDGQIRIVVKSGPFSEDVYTYPNAEEAAMYAFDSHEKAEARLLEMRYGGMQ